MSTLSLSRNEYTNNNRFEVTTLKVEKISQKDKNINSLIKTSLTGKVHRFDETMSKEVIHQKLDDLFGW